MQYEDFSVVELRQAARALVPEARGVGGIAHVGSKQDLVLLFIQKAVMPLEIAEAVSRAKEKGQSEGEPATSSEPAASSAANSEPTASTESTPPSIPETATEPSSEQPATSPTAQPANPETAPTEREEAPKKKRQTPEKDETGDELDIVRRILLKNATPEVDMKQVRELVDSSVAGVEARLRETVDSMKQAGVTRLEVKLSDASERKDIGVVHKLTPQIIKVCELGVHQMLVGPAGGGKTTCCEKVAQALNLEFYPMSVGPQTTKSDLLGFIDAAGNYHTSPLRKAFEDGGLLLLDELDAANAGVVTIINALLANGYCSFPDRVVKKHDRFRCICACNTFGRGADREYVGRNQLDAATLDRFAVVEFDYDEDLERAMAGNDSWVNEVQRYRRRAEAIKARVVISPRASIYGAKLLAAGFAKEQVLEMVIWKGISKDLRTKIGG